MKSLIPMSQAAKARKRMIERDQMRNRKSTFACDSMTEASEIIKPIPEDQADGEKVTNLLSFRNKVARIFRDVPGIGEIAGQITVYTFSAYEAERCSCDGQANVKKRSIAICEDIITESDRPYWQMVYLHELAHILTNIGHTRSFELLLDEMISLYNEATGEQLKNDYQK